MAFAREVLNLVEDMKATACGRPELPNNVPPALETFTTLEWPESNEMWRFADIPQLFNYLRGAKALRLPKEWKSVVPKSM